MTNRTKTGPKIILSSSVDQPHPVCPFEVSYAPLAQCIWSGLSNIGQKGAKSGQKGDKRCQKGAINLIREAEAMKEQLQNTAVNVIYIASLALAGAGGRAGTVITKKYSICLIAQYRYEVNYFINVAILPINVAYKVVVHIFGTHGSIGSPEVHTS